MFELLLLLLSFLFSSPEPELGVSQKSIEDSVIASVQDSLSQEFATTGKYTPMYKQDFASNFQSEYTVNTFGYADGTMGYEIVVTTYEPFQEISSSTQKTITSYLTQERRVKNNVR